MSGLHIKFYIKIIFILFVILACYANNAFSLDLFARNQWLVESKKDDFKNYAYLEASLKSAKFDSGKFQNEKIYAKIIFTNLGGKVESSITFGDYISPSLYSDSGFCIWGSCSIQVRFDDGPIEYYKMYDSPHYRRTAICCLNNESERFYKSAKIANKIEIRAFFIPKDGFIDFTFKSDKPLTWHSIDSNYFSKIGISHVLICIFIFILILAAIGHYHHEAGNDVKRLQTAHHSQSKIILKCPNCSQKCRAPANKTLEIICPSCRHTWFEIT